MKHRILSCVLALSILLSLMPYASAAGKAVYNGTTYSTDYTVWRQGDAAWGNIALGEMHNVAGSGCLITSIAIQMCASGMYDPARLNPGVLTVWLDGMGYISHSDDRAQDALLSFGRLTATTCPRFYFANQELFDTGTSMADVCSKIAAKQKEGYYIVARVKNSGHFVAVNSLTSSTDAAISDPGVNEYTLLSQYNGTIGGLLYFKANASGQDTILPQVDSIGQSTEDKPVTPTTPSTPVTPTTTPVTDNTPGTPIVATLSKTYGDGDPIYVSWDPAARATHYNIYVEAKQADGSWAPNFRYFFYASSPYAVGALTAGEYRLKVQATNSKCEPWEYANSAWQTFTVKAGLCTASYNANGGWLAGAAEEMLPADGTYSLPVPVRSDAAFLGWYTASGTLITKTTRRVSARAHTLTARWDIGANGFEKDKTAGSPFRDVGAQKWYAPSVDAVYAYGLMNGVTDSTFEPEARITGAQAITLAARLRKIYLTGDGSFSSSSPWYKTYADYALGKGIVSALPDDMNAALTRQEFAAIIANALPVSALPAVNSIANGSIPDVYNSDAAIYRLYRGGILSGTDSAGTFLPNNPITRAEVAAILVRLADPCERITFTLR